MELQTFILCSVNESDCVETEKSSGKAGQVGNGHDVDFRNPAGGLGVEEIGQNLLKLKEQHGDAVFDFSNYKPYIRLIAQCMGLKQEGLPCCYGPQMPQSIFKSVKAT